uniref:uncharacterized protein LOC129126210 n=1 Tax=Agelaius phoeniceus TaxID=39638 RepID=UPI0023EDAE27|nr:uncharacterized protein LOC129126210 [Agelaius phoeniceus]
MAPTRSRCRPLSACAWARSAGSGATSTSRGVTSPRRCDRTGCPCAPWTAPPPVRPGGREGPGLRGWSAEIATRPAAPPGPEEEEELREQRVKCLNNCAAAELKLGRTEEALAACEAALRICPDNGRALLRRGQVGLAAPRTAPLRSAGPSSHPPLLSPQLLAEQGRDAEAALVLKRALELDPASKVWEAGCEGGRWSHSTWY